MSVVVKISPIPEGLTEYDVRNEINADWIEQVAIDSADHIAYVRVKELYLEAMAGKYGDELNFINWNGKGNVEDEGFDWNGIVESIKSKVAAQPQIYPVNIKRMGLGRNKVTQDEALRIAEKLVPTIIQQGSSLLAQEIEPNVTAATVEKERQKLEETGLEVNKKVEDPKETAAQKFITLEQSAQPTITPIIKTQMGLGRKKKPQEETVIVETFVPPMLVPETESAAVQEKVEDTGHEGNQKVEDPKGTVAQKFEILEQSVQPTIIPTIKLQMGLGRNKRPQEETVIVETTFVPTNIQQEPPLLVPETGSTIITNKPSEGINTEQQPKSKSVIVEPQAQRMVVTKPVDPSEQPVPIQPLPPKQRAYLLEFVLLVWLFSWLI